MKVTIENILAIENEKSYILECSIGEELYVSGIGRKMYTLDVQEPNRKDITQIQYLTSKNLKIKDEIEIY